jgi:hypothetical protein
MNKPKKRKRWLIVLISIIVFFTIIRLILPYVVLKYVNKTLGNIKEYYGHVEDIDIALIRGAYKINGIKLVKIDSVTHQKDTTPFFAAPTIDLSVQWKAIFKGRFVGEIYVTNPVLNFINGKHKNEDATADTTDFKTTLKKLMPLKINHFEIDNGQIHYIDRFSSPAIDIPIKNIQVKAENLSNVNDSNKILPSTIVATGDIYGGKLNLNVKLNVLEKKPTFDLNAGISNVNMIDLNNFFRAYGKFEVEKGNFGLYTEFAAKNGAFKGYVKPLIKDMKVAKQGTFGQIAWEYVVSGVAEIFKNHKKDQIATEVPIEGRFDNPTVGLWTSISYVLKNAFIIALQPQIDNKIDIEKVEQPEKKKTLLQKIFDKKDKSAKKVEKKK